MAPVLHPLNHLLQGEKADVGDKTLSGVCPEPQTQRVAPHFYGWAYYGYWTEDGHLIGTRD